MLRTLRTAKGLVPESFFQVLNFGVSSLQSRVEFASSASPSTCTSDSSNAAVLGALRQRLAEGMHAMAHSCLLPNLLEET
jgi:hypothetical protein